MQYEMDIKQNMNWTMKWKLESLRYVYIQKATGQNHVHVPMLSDPAGLDCTLDPEGLER